MNDIKTLYIMPHCGFGDILVTIGLINYYADIYDIIYVYGSVHNKVNLFLEYIFKDNQKIKIIEFNSPDFYQPNKSIFPFYNLLEKEHPNTTKQNFLGLGIWRNINAKYLFDGGPRNNNMFKTIWNVMFYNQVNLLVKLSWEKFKIYRNLNTEKQICDDLLLKCNENNIVFIHDDKHRNFIIHNKYKKQKHVMPIPGYTEHMTNYISFLEMCDEIHCIDSSFSHLIDRINLKPTVKLYFHMYARKVPLPLFEKKWNVLTSP